MADRRTQSERRAETIAKVIDAAIDSLNERGWSSSTTSDIAERAGVTRQLVRHYFPDTASLFEAVIRTRAETMFVEVEAHLAAVANSGSLADRLSLAIEASMEFSRSREMYAFRELLVATRTDPELGPVVRAACADVMARVQTTFLSVVREDDEAPAWLLESGLRLVGASNYGAGFISSPVGTDGTWPDPVLLLLVAITRASLGEAREAIGAEVEAARQWLAGRQPRPSSETNP